jgi:hypothetical protein
VDVVANTTTTATVQLRKRSKKTGRIFSEFDSAVRPKKASRSGRRAKQIKPAGL